MSNVYPVIVNPICRSMDGYSTTPCDLEFTERKEARVTENHTKLRLTSNYKGSQGITQYHRGSVHRSWTRLGESSHYGSSLLTPRRDARGIQLRSETVTVTASTPIPNVSDWL
eukprot:746878-Hanusia_phi.AAC.3